VVRDQSERAVDVNPVEERFSVHIPFHGIHPLAGVSGLFSYLVKFLDPLLKHSQALLMFCQI